VAAAFGATPTAAGGVKRGADLVEQQLLITTPTTPQV
jgi:hypothetical protein